MSNEFIKNLSVELHSLTVFRALLNNEVIKSLLKFFDISREGCIREKVDAYSECIAKLYAAGYDSIGAYIRDAVNNDENVYTVGMGAGREIPRKIRESTDRELSVLQKIANLKPDDLTDFIGSDCALSGWTAEETDIKKSYSYHTQNIGRYGYGMYEKYRMFYIDNASEIVPVVNPDTVRLCELKKYEYERNIVLNNTKALVEGKPAANILLSGDAGTGKSSTIKAVVNELADEGLRIIEVRKEQLHIIPSILDELTLNPLKFILFTDDLTFGGEDDNFNALKAILEGSVSAKSQNVVVYATSNRRHLVKETFSDRQGDDIHLNDTMQQTISLSDRFGIHLTFNRPNKAEYLDIVRHIAEDYGIKYESEKFDVAAERFALAGGMRSARKAKQFVEGIVAGTIKID